MANDSTDTNMCMTWKRKLKDKCIKAGETNTGSKSQENRGATINSGTKDSLVWTSSKQQDSCNEPDITRIW